MNNDQLINKKFNILQRKKILKDSEKFIYNEIANRINDSLEGVNFAVNKCLEIGATSENIYKYLLGRSKTIEYSVLDISEDLLKILPKNINTYCFDHDGWKIDENLFNLIISNFYLDLTNNLDILLSNIYKSLIKGGFFFASIPGNSFLKELKEAMIINDIKIYGGAYRRFKSNNSIQSISELLKKNNFNNKLIDIDNIIFKYENFSKLLIDVRNLGASYMYFDRKNKFEHKEYFKILEKVYWSKFSNNNKINLTLEIIYFSGWK
jgi:SAM-dependent methyltransferase